MLKKELLEMLTGEHGEGRSFIASVEWVKENDPEIYEGLRDMMTQFIQDETNATDENDLTDFENWIAEYTFNNIDGDEEIEIVVTVGENRQMLNNQPAWIHEKITLDEFRVYWNWEAYVEALGK